MDTTQTSLLPSGNLQQTCYNNKTVTNSFIPKNAHRNMVAKKMADPVWLYFSIL